ncbi:GntR family transcriptional regulator [Streptomyces colonosanans]|uniref:GntR family transcriptional regulator n=1 Tax=Streptomyces colonosanans TaxID=1428652 RepID=A0A1S2P7H4_9ACTN|nr:GntR family transcriptional regulator [Streptomyces colonosanans]OIJ89773.1 GntR family transcriptional regulator [Streptomyces colonosanans]
MSEQPTYLRIAGDLRQRIADHEWAEGAQLPSRAQLAKDFGVSDAIIRRAQELLIAEGILEGRAGSGTYVAEQRKRLRMTRSCLSGRLDEAPGGPDLGALGGMETWESRSDGIVPAPKQVACRLGIAEGDYCVRTAYEHLSDGKPVYLSTSWEPYEITSGTLVMMPDGGPLAGAGVVRRMAEIGITVTHAVERSEPGQVNAEEANLLGIQRGAPCTRIERTFYGDDGRAVETADIVVPATLCEIVYEVPVWQGSDSSD